MTSIQAFVFHVKIPTAAGVGPRHELDAHDVACQLSTQKDRLIRCDEKREVYEKRLTIGLRW